MFPIFSFADIIGNKIEHELMSSNGKINLGSIVENVINLMSLQSINLN